MSGTQNPETVFGFPVAPVLELGEAVGHLRTATRGMVGGEGTLLHTMTGLLPVIEKGEAALSAEDLSGLRARSAGLIPRMEPYVEVLQGFRNPRAAFVKEVGRVNEAVLEAAADRHPDFGAGHVVTAIHGVVGDLIESPHEAERNLPLLSALVTVRKARPKPLRLPPALIMGPIVPEIMTMLEAPLPKTRQNPEVIARMRRSPLVMAANLQVLQTQVQALRQAAPALLPSVRNLLPITGAEVTERFEAVKEFIS